MTNSRLDEVDFAGEEVSFAVFRFAERKMRALSKIIKESAATMTPTGSNGVATVTEEMINKAFNLLLNHPEQLKKDLGLALPMHEQRFPHSLKPLSPS